MGKLSNITTQLLKKYNVDIDNGFLPKEEPISNLPSDYSPWEKLNSHLAESIKDKSFINEFNNLPRLPVRKLSKQQLDRAMLLLSAFAHSYVNVSTTNEIPSQLSIPWVEVAAQLKQLPVIAHSSLSLQNWKLKNPNEAFSLENLTTQISFTETESEAWFFNATTNIEKIGAEMIPLILESIHLANEKEFDDSCNLLEKIIPISGNLHTALKRMYEKCDPNIFFNQIRPFFDSFHNVKYIETKPEVRSFAGGSAAQSSLLQFCDMALGIDYENNPSQKFLHDMRRYMPLAHRSFIAYIEQEYNLKQAREKHPPLNKLCKEIILNLIAFRNEHLKIVSHYIIKPARENQADITGTGGTNPMLFLKDVRNKNLKNIK